MFEMSLPHQYKLLNLYSHYRLSIFLKNKKILTYIFNNLIFINKDIFRLIKLIVNGKTMRIAFKILNIFCFIILLKRRNIELI